MEKTESLFLLVLASIVHDVGKFAQRAGAPSSKDMEDTYCPQSAHGGTHRHVLYTDYFVEKDLPLPRDLEGKRSLLARIACNRETGWPLDTTAFPETARAGTRQQGSSPSSGECACATRALHHSPVSFGATA